MIGLFCLYIGSLLRVFGLDDESDSAVILCFFVVPAPTKRARGRERESERERERERERDTGDFDDEGDSVTKKQKNSVVTQLCA